MLVELVPYVDDPRRDAGRLLLDARKRFLGRQPGRREKNGGE
jgi:hypothetical protein